MKNIAAFLLLPVLILASGRAEGAPPTIHARWDNGGSLQPIETINYVVDTTETGTPAFPDVKLLTGRDDWRIWSTNLDAADGVGDVGVISSPANANFTMKLAANGSADKFMLYWGRYIDADDLKDPSNPTNPDSPAWIAYKQSTLQAMKDAGFTHLGLRIAVPAGPVVANREEFYHREHGEHGGLLGVRCAGIHRYPVNNQPYSVTSVSSVVNLCSYGLAAVK